MLKLPHIKALRADVAVNDAGDDPTKSRKMIFVLLSEFDQNKEFISPN